MQHNFGNNRMLKESRIMVESSDKFKLCNTIVKLKINKALDMLHKTLLMLQ